MKAFSAAIAAMNEIGFAVVATSVSIIAVFVPVAFMDGWSVSSFMNSMTVAFAVLFPRMDPDVVANVGAREF